MNEAREIERAGLVALEAARNLSRAAQEAKEAATSMDWAVQRLREERLAWEAATAAPQESQKPPDHLPHEGCCDRPTWRDNGGVLWHVGNIRPSEPPETEDR
jgi:hypothetical protein